MTPADEPFGELRLVYGCCFCGLSIEKVEIDPCAVIIVNKWSGPEDEQSSQQFWCHAACFRGRLSPAYRAELIEAVLPDEEILELSDYAESDRRVMSSPEFQESIAQMRRGFGRQVRSSKD
jgi:hypothetical protein